MKDRIYLVSPQFVEEKVKKIFDLLGEIGFTSRLGLVTGLREQELLYIKEKPVRTDGHGCDCENLHLVNCKNGMTIIAIGTSVVGQAVHAPIRRGEFATLQSQLHDYP